MTLKENLIQLFESWSGEKCTLFQPLPPSGSYRIYYRLQGRRKNAIGVFNNDLKENRAFIKFSEQFTNLKLNVPSIYLSDPDNNIYLLEDLGDLTLFDLIGKHNHDFSEGGYLFRIYKKIIEKLPGFQITAAKNIDYSVCYPRREFDKQSMMWDLSYFKYYFLKLAKIPFDEQLLENDFHELTNFLLKEDHDYFLYRDFQSRNIMIKDEEPFFIDYQGGRKGALQYDIASLLYDAKADIPESSRRILLGFYIEELKKYIPVDKERFLEFYYGYVLIRVMQAMGAYGFRGFYEKKTHFLQSIPYALNNLKWILENVTLPVNTPSLILVFKQILDSEILNKISKPSEYKKNNLQITINSFSYKKQIPEDKSGNGGGFVFDCRALPNPGKFDHYKCLNGLDEDVIRFLEKENEVISFLNNVYALVDQSVDKYLSRDFTNLNICFGCTGGQHRSVFCAEQLRKHIEKKFPVLVKVNHTEKKCWIIN